MCTLGICLFVGVCEGESTSKEGKTEDQKAVFFFTTKRSRGEKWAVTISRTSNTGPLRYCAVPTQIPYKPFYNTQPSIIPKTGRHPGLLYLSSTVLYPITQTI